jgi:EAL domain-containing protein (putative c-di-GMP-specific phosphodiesterase class I)/FixJ family two-component response regulator
MTTRLLIFDDDAAIGRLVARIAALGGFAATAVTDAEAFRQSLQHEPPHIVMLDLQLGATDGVEQLRHLAERQYAGALILMSGFDARVLATTCALAQGMGLNVAATLSKPIRVEDLEQALQRLQSVAPERPSTDRLLEAIHNDELVLEFQPIVSRRPKTLKKLEALVRWDHPTIGRIPPSEFVPTAEADTAVIDALTDWVVGAALKAHLVLVKLGMTVPLAVNISVQNLHSLTLPDRLSERLRSAGVAAEQLCLEITESAAFQDAGRTMDILTRIRLKGMQLAIDDFGIGYSSLKMLRQMPFSEIKTSRDARAIVKSIIDLAANMEMTCVAEGVETEETAAFLESLNVGLLQGYLIAKPMPIEAVPVWFEDWMGWDYVAPRAELPTVQAMGEGGDADAGRDPGPAVPSPALSPRQIEVLQLLTDGCAVEEIARRLDLDIGNVKLHLALACSAFGARDRVEAVMRAGLRPSAPVLAIGQTIRR